MLDFVANEMIEVDFSYMRGPIIRNEGGERIK